MPMKRIISLLSLLAICVNLMGQNMNLRQDNLDETLSLRILNHNPMIDNKILDALRGRDIVLFVADPDEISPSDVRFPVVITGMGKMRMFSGLVKWEKAHPGQKPLILNIGSAGSARYPIGEILNCTSFVNGGCELVYDKIDIPGEGCSVFSGDYFMSTQTFSPEQVKALSAQYDLFDMEAYAIAMFCKEHGFEFCCLKAVSDNLDGNLKDWRAILAQIRQQFTALLGPL